MQHSYEFFLFTIMYYDKEKTNFDEIDLDERYYNQVIPLFEKWQEYNNDQESKWGFRLSMFESIENFLSNNL